MKDDPLMALVVFLVAVVVALAPMLIGYLFTLLGWCTSYDLWGVVPLQVIWLLFLVLCLSTLDPHRPD